MLKSFEKLIKNDKLFYALPWIFLLLCIVFDSLYGVYYTDINECVGSIVCDLLIFAAIEGIVISYKKHEKNIMKALLGGILFLYASGAVTYASYFLTVDLSDIPYSIFSLVWGILAVSLLVTHFVLAQDHDPQPWIVKCNIYLVFIIFIFDLLWEAYMYATMEYSIICGVCYSVCTLTKLMSVVCVEYRVDLFKQIRKEKNS